MNVNRVIKVYLDAVERTVPKTAIAVERTVPVATRTVPKAAKRREKLE